MPHVPPRRMGAGNTSNLQMIESLCEICELQSKIIRAQNLRLGELGAVCMTDEIAETDRKLRYFLGSDELPDTARQANENGL